MSNTKPFESMTEDPLSEGPAYIGPVGFNGEAAVDVREQSYELIAIAFGPLVWCIHFLACYLTNAIYCAKFAQGDSDASIVRWSILVYTLIALHVIVGIGWLSYRRHRYKRAELPHDADSAEDRYRFLGFAGFLLASLSCVAVLFTAFVAVFIPTCD